MSNKTTILILVKSNTQDQNYTKRNKSTKFLKSSKEVIQLDRIIKCRNLNRKHPIMSNVIKTFNHKNQNSLRDRTFSICNKQTVQFTIINQTENSKTLLFHIIILPMMQTNHEKYLNCQQYQITKPLGHVSSRVVDRILLQELIARSLKYFKFMICFIKISINKSNLFMK